MSDKTDNVVTFKPTPQPKDEAFPATVKPRSYSTDCAHASVSVSASQRSLKCVKCGVEVDPYAKVEEWAHNWDRERWSIRHEKELDGMVIRFHEAGGRIVIRPSGVVAEHNGRKWASSCGGGVTEQMASALRRAEQAMRRDAKDRFIPGR